MLLSLLIACQSMPGDMKALYKPVPADCAPEIEDLAIVDGMLDVPTAEDPAFAGRKDPWCLENPLDCDDYGQRLEDGGEPAVVVETPVEEPVVEETPVEEPPQAQAVAVAAAPPSSDPVGLPSAPVWGVRLLQTLPGAHPPRAALGLPDGSEVIVAPGSMLPDPGIVVVAVGPNMAQLAMVTAEGDHAEIETVTLSAQYGSPAQ